MKVLTRNLMARNTCDYLSVYAALIESPSQDRTNDVR